MEKNNEFNNYLKTVELDNGKILYNLSCTTCKLNYFEKDKILQYVKDNYIKRKPSNKANLINDLNTFKTYRVDIEKNLQHQGIISGFFSTIATVVSVILAFELGLIQSSKNGNLNLKLINEDIKWLLIVAVFIVIGSLAILLTNLCKNSEMNKVKVLNNAIYILEAIKEDMYNTPNNSENTALAIKKDDELEKIVPDSIASETKIISSNIESSKSSSISHDLTIARDEGKTTVSPQDRHYKLSYSSEAISDAFYTDQLIDYVEKNYINRDTVDEGKLINDLILFKTMKYDIELDIKNNEKFFSGIPILKSLDTEKIRNDRWSINNRVKTINNIILVLEAIKEEIDTKKKDGQN